MLFSFLADRGRCEMILLNAGFIYKSRMLHKQTATRVLQYFQGQKEKMMTIEESSLTEGEKEILNLLMEELSDKELSAKIFISIETLNSHVRNIYHKLNVHSRSELAAKFNSQ